MKLNYLILSSLFFAAPGYAAIHPLDSLDAAEMSRAVEIIRADARLPKEGLFPSLVLNEPPKAEVLAWKTGDPFRREAFAVMYDRKSSKTFEAVVDLKEGKVASIKEMPGVQPGVMLSEFESLPKVVSADPRWVKALARRGLEDMSKVAVDIWAYGTPPKSGSKKRLMRAIAYYKGGGKNFYARPIEGLSAVVDADAGTVLDVLDTDAYPVPPTVSELSAAEIGGRRAALKPLDIVQKDGPSFTVEGQEIRWDRWRLRFSMHPREGLVIHQVRYDDASGRRSVLYRASLSEMMVPYGHPGSQWNWRAAFDEGEYGIGRYSGSLKAGVDVPENARLFPAVFADDFGTASESKDVVAVYERDGGLLWKHFDMYAGGQYARRGRELVVGFITTISNYDYGLNWIFRQDGSLSLEVQLSGIMLTKGVPHANDEEHAHAEGEGHYAHLVAPYVAAPHHQHFYSFRLDMDVDGADGNTAWEIDAESDPAGRANPANNGFTMNEKPILSEKEGARDLSYAHQRKWKITGPRKNSLGGAAGYLLVPGENAAPYLRPGSPLLARGGFVKHPVWFTRHAEGESYAAGPYPNQRAAADGLPVWQAKNRPLDKTDLVLWHNICVTHAPRPEDWPVMPVHRTGFTLLPAGFFDRNPAMDLPGGD